MPDDCGQKSSPTRAEQNIEENGNENDLEISEESSGNCSTMPTAINKNFTTNVLTTNTTKSASSSSIQEEMKQESENDCVNAKSVEQQVLNKFKALSQRIKMTREKNFSNVEVKLKQQQATILKSNNKYIEKLETATRSKRNITNSEKIVAVPEICNSSQNNSLRRTSLDSVKYNKANKSCDLNTKKSRLQLETEVSALQKLLTQLSLESPQLRTLISTMAQDIPELKQNEFFADSRLEGGFDRDGDQLPSTSRGINQNYTAALYNMPKRQHLDSVDKFSVDGQNDDDEPLEHNRRRRGRRAGRNRKNSIKQKNQANELQDLAKYINNMVESYLLKNETLGTAIRKNLHKFDGGFEKLEEYAVELAKLGLGRIVEDELRVNRKNNRQSFITMSTDRETLERDGMIMLPVARRYAFEGDIVRAFVLNTLNSDSSTEKSSDKTPGASRNQNDSCLDEEVLGERCDTPDSDIDSNELLDTSGTITAINCPKAFVIDIIKHTNDRQVVGSISFKQTTSLSEDNKMAYYKFKPLDARMPLMYVPEISGLMHAHAAKQRNEVTDLFYLAKVGETDVNGHCIAELIEMVGRVGHLEHELKAILLHNGLKDIKPFEQRFDDLYADHGLPKLTEAELQQRMDLRKKCIFTIDPLTARDLDDALSIDEINENEFEVGVHIADVSYFLDEACELDELVKLRATSIYLVNEVIHMLPETLCYKCSLLPDEDKLSFSVFWRLNREGIVLGSPRFARSIMNSCTKFAYAHAQKLIEDPNAYKKSEHFPEIYNGFTLSQISKRIRILNQMAQCMRKRRFDDGALSINNPKLRFELDPITGEPISYDIDRQMDANHMIEEFMLLANMSVARQIYTHYPDISILRNHAPPLMTSMKNLQEKLANFGLSLDIGSSKDIYNSLLRICSEAEDPKAMNACLSTMLTKPMARAKYFCSEDKTEAEMWHYALSIPIYTHFTSPIRRYPDIMVHRLLAATLDCGPLPKRTPDELKELANICNIQKYNARCAGDDSIMLYFKRYVKAKQGLNRRAAVLEVYQHLTNVVTVETGHVLPIQYKMQKVIIDKSMAPNCIFISEKGSSQPPVKLQLFSPVDIKLVIRDEKLVAFFVSPDLRQRQLNCIEMKATNNGQRHRNNSISKNQQQHLQQQQLQQQQQQVLKSQQRQEERLQIVKAQLQKKELQHKQQIKQKAKPMQQQQQQLQLQQQNGLVSINNKQQISSQVFQRRGNDNDSQQQDQTQPQQQLQQPQKPARAKGISQDKH